MKTTVITKVITRAITKGSTVGIVEIQSDMLVCIVPPRILIVMYVERKDTLGKYVCPNVVKTLSQHRSLYLISPDCMAESQSPLETQLLMSLYAS